MKAVNLYEPPQNQYSAESPPPLAITIPNPTIKVEESHNQSILPCMTYTSASHIVLPVSTALGPATFAPTTEAGRGHSQQRVRTRPGGTPKMRTGRVKLQAEPTVEKGGNKQA